MKYEVCLVSQRVRLWKRRWHEASLAAVRCRSPVQTDSKLCSTALNNLIWTSPRSPTRSARWCSIQTHLASFLCVNIFHK